MGLCPPVSTEALLTEHAKLLGLGMRWRKQHHERQQLESLMAGEP